MKKNEKRGIIISIILVIMGLVGIIYTTIIRNSVDTSVSMYSLGLTYLIIGIVVFIYYIRLSKNKKKSDEQQNIYDDERVISNSNKAHAITFKIILSTSILVDFIVTFFLREYQELANTLQNFTVFTILIYSVVYYFVSKRN